MSQAILSRTSPEQGVDGAPPSALLQLRREQQGRHEIRDRQVDVPERLNSRGSKGFRNVVADISQSIHKRKA